MTSKKININLPAKWDELSKDQFERVALLFATTQPSLIRDIKLLKVLFNIRFWHFKKRAQLHYFLKEVPYSEWKLYIDFLLKKIDRTKFVPVIRANKKKYFGPADRIYNLDAEEFAMADDLHIRYRETKDVENLQYLFHILYSETENRQEFNRLNLESKAAQKIPLKTLLITEMTYCGCKNHIAEKFKKAFPTTGEKATGKRKGFYKVIQSMAKGDLSKLPIIERTNIYKFLNQFQDDIDEYNKQKMKK